MAKHMRAESPALPLVFGGGVMSNRLIRPALEAAGQCFFAAPEFSCDNAIGTAVLTALKEGESMTEAEMKDYVRSHMAKHKVPKYVDFVVAFPMNAAGKILKYKMREDAIEKFGLQKADSIETA